MMEEDLNESKEEDERLLESEDELNEDWVRNMVEYEYSFEELPVKIERPPPTQNYFSYRFGIPFFKDKERYGCPPNEGVKIIKKCSHLMRFDIPGVKVWTDYEVNVLKKAVETQNEKRKNDSVAANGVGGEIRNATMEKSTDVNAKEAFKQNEKKIDWMELCSSNPHIRHTPEECESMWTMCMEPSVCSSDFTDEEAVRLHCIVKDHGEYDWDKIAKFLNTNRSAYQCIVYFKCKLKSVEKKPWTQKEDAKLKSTVKTWTVDGKIVWPNVTRFFTDRNYIQCYTRWQYTLRPSIKKGHFTIDEQETVFKGVKDGIPLKDIAQSIGRSSRQVYWFLDNKTKKNNGRWTGEETLKLIELVEKNAVEDADWSAISKEIKTRDRTQCRLKYVSIKDYIEELKSKLKEGKNERRSRKPKQVVNSKLDKNERPPKLQKKVKLDLYVPQRHSQRKHVVKKLKAVSNSN